MVYLRLSVGGASLTGSQVMPMYSTDDIFSRKDIDKHIKDTELPRLN